MKKYVIITLIGISMLVTAFMVIMQKNVALNEKKEQDVDYTARQEAEKVIPKTKVSFEGNWSRTDVTMKEQAGLVITEQENDHFIFELNANNGGNSGFVSGIAIIQKDGKAIYEIITEEEREYTAIIFNKMSDEIIEVSFTGDSTLLEMGNNVYIAGKYTSKEPNYTDANILNEVLYSEEMKAKAIELFGAEDYYNVVKVAIELGDHAEYVKGEIFTCFVRGLGIGIDLLISEGGEIYCLVHDMETYFYTTDTNYKNKLPEKFKTIVEDETTIKYMEQGTN